MKAFLFAMMTVVEVKNLVRGNFAGFQSRRYSCWFRQTTVLSTAVARRCRQCWRPTRNAVTRYSKATGSQDNQQQQQTLTPGSIHESEFEVKKSKFIGYARHVSSWDEASTFLLEIKSKHPKARHWCYGFRTGGVLPQKQPNSSEESDYNTLSERSSDDGEPSGTAGVPILGAIQAQGLTNVICVVVRYFGGIKLGAGGLIRAYGASARQVLREAEPSYQQVIPTTRLTVKLAAVHVGALYDVIQCTTGASTSSGDETYNYDGSLTLVVTCVADDVEHFKTALQDATRGQASIQ